MEAEDLLDKFAQDEGFGNWETVVLNCHHSVIRSVAIAAVNQALRQPLVSGSLPPVENELWIEANKLYSKKEHSQDGRDLQMKHFTIQRRQRVTDMPSLAFNSTNFQNTDTV